MMDLLDQTPDELAALMVEWGEPAYRAGQIFPLLHRGVPFEQMSALPAALRGRLALSCRAGGVTVEHAAASERDGTEKLLYRLADGHMVEGVWMRYQHGTTLCLSTQVGCRMGCAFCASTLDGLARNLTAGEMLGQVVAARGRTEIQNLVLMGSGEPLDNYDQVVRFLRLLRVPEGVNIGLRHVSLSTCGLVPQMRAFAEEGLPVTLCVSLHAPNDEIRRRLVPAAAANPMEALLQACRVYVQKTGRRVIFEYALVAGVNCAAAHAAELAARLRGLQCHVNVIPLNQVEGRALQGASDAQIQTFVKALEDRHVSVTRRRSMGGDVQGACGQLRRRYIQGEQGV
jgi:23S rRNA (adenine2503-C2)-methyltransferase